jgi:hypothetical protein
MIYNSKTRQGRSWKKWADAGAVSTAFTPLFEQIESNIRYDCHSTQTSFNRSDTKPKLIALGPQILIGLASHLRKRFPNLRTSTTPRESVDWDMFGVWVWLISSIQEEYSLPRTPYPSDLPFGKQDMEQWYEYCLGVSPL